MPPPAEHTSTPSSHTSSHNSGARILGRKTDAIDGAVDDMNEFATPPVTFPTTAPSSAYGWEDDDEDDWASNVSFTEVPSRTTPGKANRSTPASRSSSNVRNAPGSSSRKTAPTSVATKPKVSGWEDTWDDF